jgi:diamine N-acetyltransferase
MAWNMAKRHIQPIACDRVRIRLLQEADLNLTLAWRNQARVRTSLVTSRALTLEEHLAWHRSYSIKDDDFVFVIEEVRSGHAPVGQVSLYAIDWQKRTAEFGRLLIGEESALGRGLASAATRLVLDLAFGAFDLQAVRLEVFQTNARAIALYAKQGFTELGLVGSMLQMELDATAYRRRKPESQRVEPTGRAQKWN